MKNHDCNPIRRRLAVASSLALFSCFAASQAQAQSTWTGGASGSWGSPGNWLGSSVEYGTGKELIFSDATWTTTGTRIGANRTVGIITYNDNWAEKNGYVRFNSNGTTSSSDTANDLILRHASTLASPLVRLTSGMTGSVIWGTNGNAV